jgi:hypothetical protein
MISPKVMPIISPNRQRSALMNLGFAIPALALASLSAQSANAPAPLSRGEVTDQVATWTLTSQQLAAAEAWIQGHRLNCLAGLGSPPNPAVRVHLFRSDGSDMTLGFYAQPGYSAVVETHVGKKLCHYKGSEAEVASLRRAIDRPQ